MKRVLSLLGLLSYCSIFASLHEYPHYYSKQTLSLVDQAESSEETLFKSLRRDISKQNKLSYKKARSYLFGKLHLEKNSQGHFIEDVYCQKTFGKEVGVGPMRIPDHTKINCEHTWPQSRFGKKDKSYKVSDLHHLFPTYSRANSSRGNIRFGEGVATKKKCQSSYRVKEFSSGQTRYSPQTEHRGNVARALFYFSIRYKIPIEDLEESYLRKWHQEDPVDFAEKRRNQQIFEIQGNRNPFIDDDKLVDKVSNF